MRVDREDGAGLPVREVLMSPKKDTRGSGRRTQAARCKPRYATSGFSDAANLDDGAMWPTSFALTELTAAEEARIGALVKRAVR